MRHFGRIALVLAVISGVGLVGVGAAGADPSWGVDVSSGLVHNQTVNVTLSGLSGLAGSNVSVAECANAEADGTALVTIDDTRPFTTHTPDCSILAVTDTSSLTGVTFGVQVKQTGIGTSNRACYAAPATPCRLMIAAWTNQGPSPLPAPIDIAFASDPASSQAATTTTITVLGNPVAENKTAHAVVDVTATGFTPNGQVSVKEGATTLGTATLAGGKAMVDITGLAQATHTLVAYYAGNGSFLASNSSSAAMQIIGEYNISVGDVTTYNGTAGRRFVKFPVVLSKPSPLGNVSVDYQVVGGSAVVGTDVIQRAKTLVFKPLKPTVKYIQIEIVSTGAASAKTFQLVLSNPSAPFVLRRPAGTATILPSPGAGTVNIGGSSVVEGDVSKPSHVLRFPVTLSEPQAGLTTVTISIQPITAQYGKKSLAAVSTDFAGSLTKKVFIPGGLVSGYASVPCLADLRGEFDETVTATIIDVAGTPSVGVGTATGTILSDE
jgi:hypothetical protein